MKEENVVGSCSSGVAPAKGIAAGPAAVFTQGRWEKQDKFGHGEAGQMGLLDGSVSGTTTKGARDLMRRGDDNGSLHYITR
jgi:hypothetical protein